MLDDLRGWRKTHFTKDVIPDLEDQEVISGFQ